MEEKHTAESLLRESEKRRLLALEASSDGVWDWDIQTGRIITSPAYFKMLEYTVSKSNQFYPEIMTSYDDFIALLNEDSREDVIKQMQEVICGKRRFCEMELCLRTQSGGWKWILKRGKVVEWDNQGNSIRMIGTHIDINDIRKAKDAVKQSEERLRAQYLGTPLPTYTWQKSGNEFILSDFNIAASEFTNGHIAGFIGKKAHIMYKENPEIYEKIITAFNNKASCKGETCYRLFSMKKTRFTSFTCAYVMPDMVLVHMEDITKNKISEQKVKRAERELRELTAQLFKAEENVRKCIAQELHDCIGQQLSSIKYITEKIIDQTTLQHGGGENASLQQLISLVQNSIDDISRISMDLRPSTLDDLGILATISWFCREYQSIFPNIALTKEITIEEQDVNPDIRIHIFRIIQESLNNVARHSKASAVRISLTKKKDLIELSISDNGIGFNAAGNKLLLAKQRGFGLLSMKERTNYSGGTCTIRTAEGEGTTIVASWPRA